MNTNFILTHLNLKISSVLFLVICFSINSQEAMVISGGDYNGSNGSISFSVGQVFTSFHSDSNSSLLEGVQQPFEISTLTVDSVEEELLFNVFPIPTSNTLHLKFNNLTHENLTYEVINLQGKLILSGQIINSETIVDLKTLESSMYILKISSYNKVVSTRKIIKI